MTDYSRNISPERCGKLHAVAQLSTLTAFHNLHDVTGKKAGLCNFQEEKSKDVMPAEVVYKILDFFSTEL